MRTTLDDLRDFIHEEVDRLVRRSAGFCNGAGIGGRAKGSIEIPPTVSGNDKEKQGEHGEEQESGQFTSRDTTGGASR